ncbi:hypothetical protein G9A89_000430 [Geosiphon pyriformis]|nr:hypothetical protein G9A89_000430 [Geosiphon pyriformis]
MTCGSEICIHANGVFMFDVNVPADEMLMALPVASNFLYDKAKPFFDYKATVGSVIAVIKKTIKASDSEGGFKTVASRKKKKRGVLKESIVNKRVAAKVLGAHSWSSETGNTMESESIDMEEEFLVEETSVDYDNNGTFVGRDPDQTPKGLHVKTKKVLGKPLGVIDYNTVDAEDDVLDDSLLLPPPPLVKPSVQVSVHKSFALDIDLVAVAGKSFQKKVNFVRKIFSDVNSFGGASTPSKFGGIIRASFTSEKTMMAAAQLANDRGVVINTDLKCPINNHTNQAIVLKEIPVETSIEAVRAAIFGFGFIKLIKMQLVGLWQKVIVKLEDQIQTNFLTAEWFILIRKDVVHVAWADIDKQTWNARDEFRALLYMLPMGTNAHDLWNFIGLVNGKTCVIERSSVSYVRARCATVCFDSESSLIWAMANTPVIKGVAQDQFRLVKIYEKKSAPVSCSLAFGGKTWASVVGKPLSIVSFGGSAQSGSISYGKFLPTVNGELEDHLKNIESSFVSLAGQIGELAKRENIVMEVSLGDATSDKTAAVPGSTASPEVPISALGWFGFSRWCSSSTFFSMSSLVWKIATCNVRGLNNPAKQVDVIHWHKNMNNLVSIFTESKLKGKVHPWLANKFDGVLVFASGLNSGFSGAGVLIVVNSSLAKHVCKISEVPGQLLSIKLLFKNKLSVSILGLYAGASSVARFFQAGEINFFIAKAINESFFVILGGDFNEDSSHKCASFKKCFDLGLINSLERSFFAKSPTWCNSHGITKTINYMFVSSNLVSVVVDCGVDGVEEYFDTDHKTVYVSMRLGGLLDVQLNSLRKQANRDCWKYDIKNTSEIKWLDFRNTTAANAVMFSDEFVAAKQFSDLDAMLDSVSASPMNSLFLSGASFNAICSGLAKMRKSYCSFKLLESKQAEKSGIRQTIERKIESFKVDKGHTIRSVLEYLFCKVVLDHLVDGEELVLESELVKSKMDGIIEGWTRKRVSLDHVFDGAFSDIMNSIGFDKMFGVISNLPNRKAAGLSGIPNELWKHCDKSVLDMLLVLLNFCLSFSMIPKSYEWEGMLTNTRSIALIETACKILSKILSDQISLACSTFDVLHGNNFSVLKGMSTQLPIFAIELWLVLQDMRKAYDSRSLVRIKMCDKFIRFFGSIHNGHTNRVMTDFGLTNGYHGKVFSPLLWYIFYDLLLCEVKRQESICGYRLISHFISKTGRAEFQAGLSSFLVGSSQAATQYILNIASEFFHLNNISINNDKTVAILINCRVTALYLIISGMPISIAKRGEPHHYLGIFLSSDGLSKPSLVKVHSDVQFFINLILRKVISNKQFAYLVSSILFPIVSYRIQFNALICKGLKSKSELPLDFLNDALHHPFLYNLKTFEQIQAESKSASVIAFANSIGVLGHLFFHRSHDLQVLSWHPHYPLLFSVCVRVSLSNNFLAGVVCIFSGCDLSLGGSLAGVFRLWCGTSMSLVLNEMIFFKCVSSFRHYGIAFVEQLCDRNGIAFDWKTFKHWKRLDPCSLVSSWFNLSIRFLNGVASLYGCSPHEGVGGFFNIRQSLGFGVICNNLLGVRAIHLSVYTDGFLSNLGTVDMLADAAVFFENINSGLDMGVSGLVSSTLAELQAIALALECVLFSRSAVIDACRLESLLVGPDFKNHCWIEHCYIANIIHYKNLDVNWIKVKGHLGVSDNKCVDALAMNTAFFAWHLPHLVSERFLKAGVNMVSGNSRHFVRDVFRSIHRVHWEVGSGSQVVPGCLHADIDWLRSSLVWHLDFHMATGFTSVRMAGFRTYFMKVLHHHHPVAV